MAWRCAKAAPRRGSRLNTATNCAPSVACTAGAKAWSAMLPVPKRAIPRDIVSVSFYQAGGDARETCLSHAHDHGAQQRRHWFSLMGTAKFRGFVVKLG